MKEVEANKKAWTQFVKVNIIIRFLIQNYHLHLV
jgi:hypothetical protein